MSPTSKPNGPPASSPQAGEVAGAQEAHIQVIVEDYLQRLQAGEEPDIYGLLLAASFVAQLRHPNIVPLHETGEDAGLWYIDMELVEGESREAWLKRAADQPLDARVAAGLVQKIAAALDHAHQAGIVHRDVKP